MSAATTEAITRNRVSVLADYEIHRSDTQANQVLASTHPEERQQLRPVENPSYWPTDYHKIPPYRPVNRNLDRSERAVYLNGVERAFIAVMFSGVWFNAGIAQLWRATGGRFNNTFFQHAIGGEW